MKEIIKSTKTVSSSDFEPTFLTEEEERALINELSAEFLPDNEEELMMIARELVEEMNMEFVSEIQLEEFLNSLDFSDCVTSENTAAVLLNAGSVETDEKKFLSREELRKKIIREHVKRWDDTIDATTWPFKNK